VRVVLSNSYSVMPLRSGSEIEGIELAMARKQSGLETAMSFRSIFQSSDLISPSRMPTGSSSTLELVVIVITTSLSLK
jgi:hypothetical protein